MMQPAVLQSNELIAQEGVKQCLTGSVQRAPHRGWLYQTASPNLLSDSEVERQGTTCTFEAH